MRAMVFEGPRRAVARTVDLPHPAPGEVRVRLDGCGVCGSNLPVWDGQPWMTYPLEAGAPGHEGWGVVDARGDGVSDLAIGQRVAVLSTRAYAQYDVATADAVVPLPEALAGRPALSEPLDCAVNVVDRARLVAGQPVAVVGVGFLGALVVGLAALRGARVTAVSRRPYARAIAELHGAERVAAFDTPAERLVADACPHGFPVVIETVGTQSSLDLASALTAVRGTLVIAGYHQDGPRRVDLQSWNWRGLDVVNAHERDPRRYVEGMRTALGLAAAGQWQPWDLVTHTLPLDALDDAFTLMTARPDGFLKAVVVP